MDRNYLYQVDIRGWIENGLDAEIMVPVSGNRVNKNYDVYIQSFLLPTDAVEADMKNDTYNAHSMEPGIIVGETGMVLNLLLLKEILMG